MTLTPKEQELLKDLLDGEKLCKEKYQKYAEAAIDPQLKSLFSEIAKVEDNHYNVISKMQSGTVPTGGSGTKPSPTFTPHYDCNDTPDKQADAYLCTDILSMEKHISGLYDTCVFEFGDADARNVLSGIQKDEQDHGKLVYDYMNVNCMYN